MFILPNLANQSTQFEKNDSGISYSSNVGWGRGHYIPKGVALGT